MNVLSLIDSIVRQTTVLIAQLATTGGVRAPLAHVAGQVFLDLTDELQAQGISRRVSADMFGLALRSYLRKIQRVRESSTDRGRSLWEAVFAWISDQARIVTRPEVFERFHRDDPELVRGVLHDLCEGGYVMRVGSGPSVAYRALSGEELSQLERASTGPGTEEFVWAVVFREGPLTRAELGSRVRSEPLDASLAHLTSTGRIQCVVVDGEPRYSAPQLVVPLDAPVGWEASVFDHFQAMVRTICGRLNVPPDAPTAERPLGGSTYSFDIWPGHPLEQNVLSQLTRLRETTSQLRERVRAHNAVHPKPKTWTEVTFYAGQCLTPQEADPENAS